jgi:hypothetical protein
MELYELHCEIAANWTDKRVSAINEELFLTVFFSLFSDEIINFASPLTANTGVRNYCFNKFQPINFHRFFTMQVFFLIKR